MNTFSGSACIRFAWETFKKRPWFFVGVTVIIAVISGISGQLTSGTHSGGGQTVVLVAGGFFISFVISMLVKMGSINLYLKALQDPLAANFEDLWAPQKLVSFTLASILVGIIVVLGLLLLIVPGIMWGLRYAFVPYLIIDKGLDVTAALRESARITLGHKWALLGLFVLLAFLNLLGLVCLIVGLLVTVPVSMLATVRAYRVLSSQT